MSHKLEDIDRDKLPPLPDIEPLPEFESLRKPITPVPPPPLPDIEPLHDTIPPVPSPPQREGALICETESDE